MRRTSTWLLIAALFISLPAVAQWQDRGQPPVGHGYGQNYIPEGTRFVVVLDDKLETKKLEPGKKFKAKLAEDLVAPNGDYIPRGKKVKGHVSSVQKGGAASVILSFDEIETRKGSVPIAATVIGVPNERGVKVIGNEGEIERKGSGTRRILTTAAAGAGVGAATGAITGGARGAIIGAAAGAAVGGTAGLLMKSEMKLDKGTQLEIALDRPLFVPNR